MPIVHFYNRSKKKVLVDAQSGKWRPQSETTTKNATVTGGLTIGTGVLPHIPTPGASVSVEVNNSTQGVIGWIEANPDFNRAQVVDSGKYRQLLVDSTTCFVFIWPDEVDKSKLLAVATSVPLCVYEGERDVSFTGPVVKYGTKVHLSYRLDNSGEEGLTAADDSLSSEHKDTQVALKIDSYSGTFLIQKAANASVKGAPDGDNDIRSGDQVMIISPHDGFWPTVTLIQAVFGPDTVALCAPADPNNEDQLRLQKWRIIRDSDVPGVGDDKIRAGDTVFIESVASGAYFTRSSNVNDARVLCELTKERRGWSILPVVPDLRHLLDNDPLDS